MEFGMQFFPNVGPQEKSAQQYFDESLRLCEIADPYGYTHIRTVEHYFEPYGGYSPNPHIFLTAASQRTRKARMVTGAVLPAFNNPLKIAGEIGMLDAISNGRLECGFARAFLPHEFERFGVSLDESVERFDEGLEQVRRLLEEENVSCTGKYHSFSNVTSLPRPTQKPRPRFWTAAFGTPASFEKAGRAGQWIMAIPIGGAAMGELLGIYREAWKSAGHAGRGRVMLAIHMFCDEDRKRAMDIAREPVERYFGGLVESARGWLSGASTQKYPNYDKLIAQLAEETLESQMEKSAAWVGTPKDLIEQIAHYEKETGGFEDASLQVNFTSISYEDADHSVRLFGEQVIPRFSGKRAAAE